MTQTNSSALNLDNILSQLGQQRPEANFLTSLLKNGFLASFLNPASESTTEGAPTEDAKSTTPPTTSSPAFLELASILKPILEKWSTPLEHGTSEATPTNPFSSVMCFDSNGALMPDERTSGAPGVRFAPAMPGVKYGPQPLARSVPIPMQQPVPTENDQVSGKKRKVAHGLREKPSVSLPKMDVKLSLPSHKLPVNIVKNSTLKQYVVTSLLPGYCESEVKITFKQVGSKKCNLTISTNPIPNLQELQLGCDLLLSELPTRVPMTCTLELDMRKDSVRKLESSLDSGVLKVSVPYSVPVEYAEEVVPIKTVKPQMNECKE